MENFNIGENYQIVILPDGTPLTQNNRLCFQNLIDGEIVFVEMTEENKENKGLTMQNETQEDLNGVVVDIGTASCSDESSSKRLWTKNAVLTLIDLMQTFDRRFKSSTEKNEKVWQALTKEMNENKINVTVSQCRDKWKYLKMRYVKKKDNMGSKESGTQPIKFEFFEEMDELLSKNHNVKPIALASSLEGVTLGVTTETSEDDENVLETNLPRRSFSRKRKEDVLQTLVDEIKKSAKSREDHRQAQIKAKEEATKVFASKMDELIKVLTPNK